MITQKHNDAPYYVQWIATHKCNLNCEHCGTDAGDAIKDELTTEEIKKCIKDMGEMGVNFFSITGGEALLREDIFEVLEYAKKCGIRTGLVTHGTLINNFKEKLKKAKIDSVMVSIDGNKETHNNFRGDNSNFDKSMDAVRFFRNIDTKIVSICTLVNKKNLDQLNELKEIVLSSGANYWRLNITIPEGRARGKDWMYLDNKEMVKLFDFIKKFREEYNLKIELCEAAGYAGKWENVVREYNFRCYCGTETCTIMANGDVMGCPVFEDDKDLVEGNIKEMPFKEIWNTKFQRFRKLQLDETCEECDYLDDCRGGCWIMRLYDSHCFKDAWEKNPPKDSHLYRFNRNNLRPMCHNR